MKNMCSFDSRSFLFFFFYTSLSVSRLVLNFVSGRFGFGVREKWCTGTGISRGHVCPGCNPAYTLVGMTLECHGNDYCPPTLSSSRTIYSRSMIRRFDPRLGSVKLGSATRESIESLRGTSSTPNPSPPSKSFVRGPLRLCGWITHEGRGFGVVTVRSPGKVTRCYGSRRHRKPLLVSLFWPLVTGLPPKFRFGMSSIDWNGFQLYFTRNCWQREQSQVLLKNSLNLHVTERRHHFYKTWQVMLSNTDNSRSFTYWH